MIKVYVDGSSRGNPGPAGIGVYIPSAEIELSEYIGAKTNNEAEAIALLRALEVLSKGWQEEDAFFTIFTDSAVIHGHLVSGWKVNAHNLKIIYAEMGKFKVNYKLELIRSEDNLADRLAKLASDTKQSSGRFEVTSDASKTDDSKKLIEEPTTDASKDYAALLEHETPMACLETEVLDPEQITKSLLQTIQSVSTVMDELADQLVKVAENAKKLSISVKDLEEIVESLSYPMY